MWAQKLGNKTKAYKENHMHLKMLSVNNEISENFKIPTIHKVILSLIPFHLQVEY